MAKNNQLSKYRIVAKPLRKITKNNCKLCNELNSIWFMETARTRTRWCCKKWQRKMKLTVDGWQVTIPISNSNSPMPPIVCIACACACDIVPHSQYSNIYIKMQTVILPLTLTEIEGAPSANELRSTNGCMLDESTDRTRTTRVRRIPD